VLFAIVVFVQACRELNVSLGEFFGYVVPRAVLGAVPALGVLLWFKHQLDVRGLVPLAVAGAVMVLVFAATSVFYVYRNDRYLDLRASLPWLGGTRGPTAARAAAGTGGGA
jgi:phosphoglycerol transferase MdoB-like AlkP superfamily enzyme